MQYAIARRAMSFLASQGKQGHLDNIGVSIDDFNKVIADVPWLGVDRSRVFSTLSSLITSTIDILGLPRFPLPAEYVAAGIALFVSPINVNAACCWMERSAPASELGRGIDDVNPCTPQQLFALVVQLVGDPEHSVARHLFYRNTSISLSKVPPVETGFAETSKSKVR